jgi:hypothetical protein
VILHFLLAQADLASRAPTPGSIHVVVNQQLFWNSGVASAIATVIFFAIAQKARVSFIRIIIPAAFSAIL